MTIHNRCNWCFLLYSTLRTPHFELASRSIHTWLVLNGLIHIAYCLIIQPNIVRACSTNFDTFFSYSIAKIQQTAIETGIQKAAKHSVKTLKRWRNQFIFGFYASCCYFAIYCCVCCMLYVVKLDILTKNGNVQHLKPFSYKWWIKQRYTMRISMWFHSRKFSVVAGLWCFVINVEWKENSWIWHTLLI